MEFLQGSGPVERCHDFVVIVKIDDHDMGGVADRISKKSEQQFLRIAFRPELASTR